MSLKKFIAREGLILIGTILTGSLLFLIGDYFYYNNQNDAKPAKLIDASEYPKDLSSYSNEELMDIIGFTDEERKALNALENFRKRYPQTKDLDNLSLAKLLASQYPEYRDVVEIVEKVDQKIKGKTKRMIYIGSLADTAGQKEGMSLNSLISSISIFGLYILIFGYPVYLILRFIVWAIRTLRRVE